MVEPRYGELDPSTPEGRRAVGEGNRLSWNEATKAHNSHKADQAKFFREGRSKLYDEELGLLGDVEGKSVLHLQCNSGQDTLSIAQMGGVVTGVDISDEAIDFARKLSADSGVPGTFHRADVYDWLADAAEKDERWDIVFCSYGAIIWLGDLTTWANGLAKLLKPGGRFITVEFHPIEMMFEGDDSHHDAYSTRGTVLLTECIMVCPPLVPARTAFRVLPMATMALFRPGLNIATIVLGFVARRQRLIIRRRALPFVVLAGTSCAYSAASAARPHSS